MAIRTITQIIQGNATVDGAGVHLTRVLGLRTTKSFDPFLMLDIFDSADPEDYVKGFPWHPHRGIETLTYLIEGEIEHADSLGNAGTIGPGDCQWMRAGSGIIHQEMPQPAEQMRGFQLWLNMPAANKMDDPKYNDLTANQIGKYADEEKEVRVIAGNWNTIQGAMQGEYYPVNIYDVQLKGGRSFTARTQKDETLFVYIYDGELDFGDGKKAVAEQAILTGEGDELVVTAGADKARFIVVAASPLNEDVHWGGPIVMSTREDLELAFKELDDGTFIKHKPAGTS